MGVDSRALLLPGADGVRARRVGQEQDRLPQEEGLHISRAARHRESVEGGEQE